MLAFECSNPVFGRSLNPFSPDHTPGGSSGGEGALIALDGSALGIGVSVHPFIFTATTLLRRVSLDSPILVVAYVYLPAILVATP